MTDTEPTRRQFLSAFAASGLAFSLASRSQAYLRAPVHLRVAIVGTADTPAAASMLRGIALGLHEASRTAGMFGVTVNSEYVALADLERGAKAGVTALIGGASASECTRLAEIASPELLYLNTGCAGDALRSSSHVRNSFHITPSESMLSDAVARATGSLPEKSSAPGDAGGRTGPLVPVAWHSSLSRFGAEQLNARFRARYGSGMDGPAWCGWVGVKILVEAVLRCKSTETAAVRAFLEADGSRFDGHKGISLSFRHDDHQLLQPVYVLENGNGTSPRVIGETA